MKKIILQRNLESIEQRYSKPLRHSDFKASVLSLELLSHVISIQDTDASSHGSHSSCSTNENHPRLPYSHAHDDTESVHTEPASPSASLASAQAELLPSKDAALFPVIAERAPVQQCKRRRRTSLALPPRASTEPPPGHITSEWLGHFKKADFGQDYELRPRTKKPEYGNQCDAVPKPRRRRLPSGCPDILARLKRRSGQRMRPFKVNYEKTARKARQGNLIHCSCLSSWDVGPQIECEKCELWQHKFCAGVFGKKTDGYNCHVCSPERPLPSPSNEEAYKAFMAYAMSLPIDDDSNDAKSAAEPHSLDMLRRAALHVDGMLPLPKDPSLLTAQFRVSRRVRKRKSRKASDLDGSGTGPDGVKLHHRRKRQRVLQQPVSEQTPQSPSESSTGTTIATLILAAESIGAQENSPTPEAPEGSQDVEVYACRTENAQIPHVTSGTESVCLPATVME